MANLFEKFRKQSNSEQENLSVAPVSSDELQEPSETTGEPSEKVRKKVNRTRDKTMNLRFSSEELEEMNEKISLSRMSRTDFVLGCVRNQTVVVVPDLIDAMIEIRKQGVNLNQIAKSLNEYAVGLEKYNIRINNENRTWAAITIELEDLREENKKTQELLNKIFEKVEEAQEKR